MLLCYYAFQLSQFQRKGAENKLDGSVDRCLGPTVHSSMKVNKQIIGKIKAFFFLLNIIVNSPQNVNEVLLTGDRISCLATLFLTLCH